MRCFWRGNGDTKDPHLNHYAKIVWTMQRPYRDRGYIYIQKIEHHFHRALCANSSWSSIVGLRFNIAGAQIGLTVSLPRRWCHAGFFKASSSRIGWKCFGVVQRSSVGDKPPNVGMREVVSLMHCDDAPQGGGYWTSEDDVIIIPLMA